MPQAASQPIELRKITTAVAATESAPPTYNSLTNSSFKNPKANPELRMYPFIRFLVEGTGTAGDILEVKVKLPGSADTVTLARLTAGTGGRFPALSQPAERFAGSYGVRVILTGVTALNNVTVYLQGFHTDRAQINA